MTYPWLTLALLGGALACTNPNSGTGSVASSGDPGTKGLHRLNSTEYNATVADVLGTKLRPASSLWLGGELDGFDNMASVLNVDAAQYRRYFDAAQLIADDVFASANLKANVVICATADDACVHSILANAGLHLFRRPLAQDEIATYYKLYAAARQLGESHEGSVKQVLRALLASAEFIYRIEFDPDLKSTTKHPLNSYELATRLSYFLWSSAPDDALLAAAEDNSLLADDTLRATLDRMLAEPVKSSRFVENFAGQWLGARKLPEHSANPYLFPAWSSELANSLTQEMYLYFGEFLQTDRSWLEFMTADFNFVDPSVAKLYGLPSIAQAGMHRVEITDDQRFGFAGLGGFLALSSLGGRTSPTLRGRYVLKNLLCTEPPKPPPGVPTLSAGGLNPTRNVRAALEEHRKDPACASCHALFDPYGLSLEQFDAIGAYRTTYFNGAPIDPSVELAGVTFTGLSGLAETVTRDPNFSECISETLLKYALGRPITDADRSYLTTVNQDWLKGTPSIRRLVYSLVLAEPFRFRHGALAQ